jgi:hypothetical protein
MQCALLAAYFLLVHCLAYSLTLKMVAICLSETLVNFPQVTQHYIPDDRTLHSHPCENHNSNMRYEFFLICFLTLPWLIVVGETMKVFFFPCTHGPELFLILQ